MPCGRYRVRICTRPSVTCAQADRKSPEPAPTCPYLHTRGRTVCTNGHERRHAASIVSVFAHAPIARVQIRTVLSLFCSSHVRFCTRHVAACAETDMCAQEIVGLCPYLHTRSIVVCKYGHVRCHMTARMTACARTDTSCPYRLRTCMLVHTTVPVVCCCAEVC